LCHNTEYADAAAGGSVTGQPPEKPGARQGKGDAALALIPFCQALLNGNEFVYLE
jgi:hypothetical protein